MPTLIMKGVYIGLIIIVIRIEMRSNIVTKYTVNVGGGGNKADNKITPIIMPVDNQDSFRTVATKALELRDTNRVPVFFSFNKIAIICELGDNIGSVIDRYHRLHCIVYKNSY